MDTEGFLERIRAEVSRRQSAHTILVYGSSRGAVVAENANIKQAYSIQEKFELYLLGHRVNPTASCG